MNLTPKITAPLKVKTLLANLKGLVDTLANSASYRAMVEAVDRSQMMIELAMDETVLKVNQNYTRCFGYTPDEVIGRRFRLVVTPEDLQSGAYDAFWEALRRGKFQTGQFQRVTKSGEPIWIEASYNPILNAQGVPIKVVGLLMDVSARVRMERDRERQDEALRKSEQFLEETGRLAGVGGWEVDLTTGSVTWMPETYRLLGADLSYRPTLAAALDLYTEESRPLIVEAIERAKTDGTGFNLELSLIRIDGRQIWARVVGKARFVDGKAVSLFGAFQDITRRIEESRALQWANHRAELATASGGIGIWDWNLQRNTLVCDAQMYRMVQLEPPSNKLETDFDTWSRFVHPDDRTRVEQQLRDAVNRVKPYETEYRILLDDGLHFIRATGQVSCDDAGRPVRMVGTNVDITQQKQTEVELREQASLLDLCHDAIIVRDLDGTIRFWNRGAEEIYGYRKDQAIGHTSHQVLQTIFPAPLGEIERTLLERGHWEGELDHTTANLEHVFVASRWALKRDKSGRPCGVMEINTNVSEQKEAEEALAAVASLVESSDAGKSRDLILSVKTTS